MGSCNKISEPRSIELPHHALFFGVLVSSSPLAAHTGFAWLLGREVYVKSIGASEERIREFILLSPGEK